jgi:C4-type Zn-finger protein
MTDIEIKGLQIPKKIHSQALRKAVATALNIDPDRVSVSAFSEGVVEHISKALTRKPKADDAAEHETDSMEMIESKVIEPTEARLVISVPDDSDVSAVHSVVAAHNPKADEKEDLATERDAEFEQKLLQSPTIKKLLRELKGK